MSDAPAVDLGSLGSLRGDVEAALDRLAEADVPARIAARDHTVWSPDPEEIENRLFWLDAPFEPPDLERARRLLADAHEDGVDRALLLGMGGSSLAPEVFGLVFGPVEDGLDLRTLDSTDPAAVRALLAWAEPERTLVIVSSKSGTTVETLSLFRAFWSRAAEAIGDDAAGARFAAVTDPGTPLEETARDLGFREVFGADPDVGGRYSALTWFGLAPAILSGLDAGRLLERARTAATACREADPRANPGARLGAVLGAAAEAGRDKATLVLSPAVEPLGAWIEQLLAESTGKDGRGILPVVETRPAGPEAYGEDRLFAHLRLDGGAEHDPAVAALERAGIPVVRGALADLYDLGAWIYVWEHATAVAGHLLGVHPFDQPNVESAKRRATERVESYRETGSLEEPAPDAEQGGLSIWAGFDVDDLEGAVRGLVERTVRGGYVAVQAFLTPDEATDAALERVADGLRARTGLAVTHAYGPRYLHSTGQLHKGDAGDGAFLVLTRTVADDVPIPDQPGGDTASLTFGVLIRAQALGDQRALEEAGRVVVRIDLGADVAAGLERLVEAIG